MEKQQLTNKIEKLSEKNGKFGENIHILQDAVHGCRINEDRTWVAQAVKIENGFAQYGKVTWNFDDVENYDENEDASDFPWDDESIMNFERECTYDLSDPDEIGELLGMI